MRSKRTLLVVVVVATLALFGTACGDDDDGQDLAEEILSDVDEDFTDLSDLTDVSDTFTDFSDFSDFDVTGGDACGEPPSGDIGSGDSVGGSIDDQGDVVAYEFSGDGSTVDIAAEQTDDDTLDPIVTVCDSDENPVASNDDGPDFPNSLIEDFEAEDGEDYVIAVAGFGGSTGEFELSVS